MDFHKSLKRIIRENIFRVLDEGIDFDPNTRTVAYNPSHENNVDTSIENNPTLDGELIPNVEVWSIFKRKKGLRGDGNPLIYALKNEGWQFRSEADKNAINRQFNLIADKFVSQHPIGITILVPSENPLNEYIANIILSKAQNAKLLEGVIRKMTTEEVEHIVLYDDNCQFRRYYGQNFNTAYEQLCVYLERMDAEKNGKFSRHYILDSQMRDVIDMTLKVSDERIAEYANLINGQNILIIDDTISRGQSIKEACKIILDSYAPKSITVLTLLSKLY